jgi:hypothetical protein
VPGPAAALRRYTPEWADDRRGLLESFVTNGALPGAVGLVAQGGYAAAAAG